MELPGFIDEDIFYSFGYWAITLGAMLALMIGFKVASSGVWGSDAQNVGIPLMSKVLILALTPVASYFVAQRVFR